MPMTLSSTRPGQARALATRAFAAALLLPLLAGCDTDEILRADDPDPIAPEAVNSAEGADALRLGAIVRLKNMTAGGESTWLLGGMLADEYRSADTFTERNETDQRSVQTNNGNVNTAYRNIHRTRLAANQAIVALKEFRATNTTDIAEAYMIRGFAELTSAQDFCNGQPFSDATGDTLVYGDPVTSEQAYRIALASLDTALTTVGATGGNANTALVRNSIRTLRGRVLVSLAQFDLAAQAVAGVPTNFAYLTTYQRTSGDNQIWALNISARRWTVANAEGGNGLNFVAANDFRSPTCAGGSTECRSGVQPGTTTTGFDGSTAAVFTLLWPNRESPAVIVNGVEARLIEAEAQLRAGSPTEALATLNTLRATPSLYRCPAATSSPSATNASCPAVVDGAPPPTLAPLAAAATPAAQQDQLFRERAFWLFGRGHRLGDLRRLVRQYGRDQTQVFPTGAFFKGGFYGSDVNFPVTQAEENNPNFKGCADRNA